MTDGEPVQVSGINALRSDLSDDPEAMQAVGFFETEIDEFVRYELTVAIDGGWPVQLDVEREVSVAAAMRMYGLPTEDLIHTTADATVYERLLLSHINDASIEVDLPLLAG